MTWTIRAGVATTLALLAGCDREPVELAPDAHDPTIDAQDPPPDPPPVTVTVTLDGLQPGWLVTTSRLVGQDAPTEQTAISDGMPIELVGTASDVFVATITDGLGNLIATRAMKAPCTMAASRQLRVPSEFPTIQAAIDVASPGDTVKVAPGTYTESLTMRAGVCLLGSGAKHTVLDAQLESRTLIDLSRAPGSVVAGFTIKNTRGPLGCADDDVFTCSGNWYRTGIYLGGTDWIDATAHAPPIIANNIFDNHHVALMLYWHGIAIVRNNVFVNNTNAFVANHYQDRTLVANNVFVNNGLAIGNQAAYLDIIDNVIVGSDLAIRFMYIQTGHIGCNIFYANTATSNDSTRFAIGQNGNVEAEPRFVGNGDYHLQNGSPGKDAGCHHGKVLEFDGSAPDIGAYGGPFAAWADL